MSKIAIVGNQAFSLINFRGDLIRDLVGKGHQVYAFAPNMSAVSAEQLASLGAEPIEFKLKRTGLNPLSDLTSLIALWTILRRIGPDVSLGYAAKPAIYGTLAAWAARVPRRYAMVEGLGYVFIDRPAEGAGKRVLRRLVKELYRLALSRATRVFFLNDDDIADFTTMGLMAPDKVIKLGGIGVDLNHWRVAPSVSEPLTFTFVGRLLRDKGVREFVSAAREIKRAAPHTRFLLIGGIDTNPESVARHEVEAWVDEGLLEWPGHVPVEPWLIQTSVFVLPSYREGVPRSTQEAMAMGRAVITTDAPGCRETVIDGDNGFLVPPRHAEMLAAAMSRFIDNPHLVASMGHRSREIAEERFDVRKVNKVMIDAMKL